MGADITVYSTGETSLGEPEGTIEAKYSELHGIDIGGRDIPLLIDEIPLLAVAAAKAKGRTTVRDAKELRIKESDRIAAIAANMTSMGITMEEQEEGFSIEGVQYFKGGTIDPRSDHRIAMSFAIAALTAENETKILNPGCAGISYPGFWEIVRRRD
jgi:3-phosphoshikimate 1-carboxyvinyltransferase